jgi:hypothetical protein
MPRGSAISGYLMGKTLKVRHYETIASLLAVVNVFIGLWTRNIYILQSEKGRAYRRDKTTYVAKNAGGYLRDSTVHVHVAVPAYVYMYLQSVRTTLGRS